MMNKAKSNYNSVEPLPDNLQDVTLELEHIPMDLPGLWRVGVQVELDKAEFTTDHNREGKEVPDLEFWGGNETMWPTMKQLGYDMERYIFYEYVILSAPCNPMEEKTVGMTRTKVE
jgi:hypothetical protein